MYSWNPPHGIWHLERSGTDWWNPCGIRPRNEKDGRTTCASHREGAAQWEHESSHQESVDGIEKQCWYKGRSPPFTDATRNLTHLWGRRFANVIERRRSVCRDHEDFKNGATLRKWVAKVSIVARTKISFAIYWKTDFTFKTFHFSLSDWAYHS